MCLLILKAGGQIVLGGVEEGGGREAERADVTPALMKSGTQAQRSRRF